MTSRPAPSASTACRLLAAQRHVPKSGAQPAFLHSARHEVHRGGPDEARHEDVGRAVVQLLRRGDLLEHPEPHHRNPVAERHRLDLIVGHVDHRGAEPALDPGYLGAHLHAQFRVEVGQRLVHEERGRVADDRPAHRDPLPLAAGQVGRLAVQVLGQVKDAGGLADLLVDDGLRGLRQLQREAHVLADRHVRVERVALEHHGDVAVLRRLVVHHLPGDAQFAFRDVLKSRDHVEGRRLAAPGRADQDDELTITDFQADVVHRERPVRIALADVVQDDVGHDLLLSFSRPTRPSG